MNHDRLRKSRAVCRAKRRAQDAEARRIRKLQSDSWESGNQTGYRQRDQECTRVLDIGDDTSVWLTPRPERDVMLVAPPCRVPLTFSDYQMGPDIVRPLIFRPRVIAECYDGIQYRQVLWERSR
jgi:hypothetical protein